MITMLLTVIGISSLYNVYSPSVTDGTWGRVLYLSTAMICVTGVLQHGRVSDAVLNVLVLLFALRSVRRAVFNGMSKTCD